MNTAPAAVDWWYVPATRNGKPVLRWCPELKVWEQIWFYQHDPKTLPADRRELH